MSEFHRQQAFGSETFIDVSANGNSSGRDAYANLDAAHLYHENNYRALPHPLQIPQDGFAHGHFAYASHSSSGVSLPGKRTALFINISLITSHLRAIFSLCDLCTSHLVRSLLVVLESASLGCWLSSTSF
jgi:hypothetical protein